MIDLYSAEGKWHQIARHAGYTSEKEMWERMYEVENRSFDQLAKIFGYGTTTISRRLNRCGIPIRGRGGPQATSRIQHLLFHADQRWLRLAPPQEIQDFCGGSYDRISELKREYL
jgi:hypothetical protein